MSVLPKIISSCVTCPTWTNDNEDKIQSIKNAWQLGLCLRLYKDFACQFSFDYYVGKNQQNFEKMLPSYKYGKIRLKREVPLEIPRENMSVNNYVQYILTYPVDTVQTELKKCEYNYFYAFFTHMSSMLKSDFNTSMPSWETDWRNADWKFFLNFDTETLKKFNTVEPTSVAEAVLVCMSEYYQKLGKSANPFGCFLETKLKIMYQKCTDTTAFGIAHCHMTQELGEDGASFFPPFELYLWLRLRNEIANTLRRFEFDYDNSTFVNEPEYISVAELMNQSTTMLPI